MRIALDEKTPLRLDWTLESGQVFRWRPGEDGWWYGSLRGTALALRQEPDALHVQAAGDPIGEGEIRAFLGLNDPLPAIRERLSFDPVLRRAFAECYGLRIVHQDPWEGLVAFICSSHNAVFRIRQMTECLAMRFGRPLSVRDHVVYTFPSASDLFGVTVGELAPCRLGYRDGYVLEAARMVATGEVDLLGLEDAPEESARSVLTRIPGVGAKVSDCVLLMALGHKASTFPIDVWVRRAVLKHYRQEVRAATGVELPGEDKGLSDRQYRAIVVWARRRFGTDAGYAQTYLFFAARAGLL